MFEFLPMIVGVLVIVPTADAATVVTAKGARPTAPPAIAVDDSGRVVVAWTELQNRSVVGLVRRADRQGQFGRPQGLAGGAFLPQVAAGLNGGAAAIYGTFGKHGMRYLSVRVARGAARFAAAQRLVAVKANITSWRVLALGSTGRYLAIWWQGIPGQSKHAVRYAISSAAGRFGKALTLAPDTGPLTGVSVAQDTTGSVLAVWGTPLVISPPNNQQLASAVLAPDASAFSAPTEIDATVGGAEEIGGAAGGPGGTALAWTQEAALPQLLQASFDRIHAVNVTTIQSNDLGAHWGTGPALALPARGPVAAAYAIMDGIPGDNEVVTAGKVFAVDRATDGSFGTPVQLSAADGSIASDPQAAASASKAVVVWTTGDFPSVRSWFATRDTTGSWSPLAPVSTDKTERSPVLASSQAGVVAAWQTGDTHGLKVESGKVSLRWLVKE